MTTGGELASGVFSARVALVSEITSGCPHGIRIRGRDFFVWWGQDVNDNDRVQTDGRRVISFPSETACLSWAAQTGLAVDEDMETGHLDCDGITPWLQHAVSMADYPLALDIVNLSIDISGSVGETWDPRYGQARRVYDKFFAASVPWFYEMEAFTPRWSAHELAQARSVVQRSIDLMRRVLVE